MTITSTCNYIGRSVAAGAPEVDGPGAGMPALDVHPAVRAMVDSVWATLCAPAVPAACDTYPTSLYWPREHKAAARGEYHLGISAHATPLSY